MFREGQLLSFSIPELSIPYSYKNTYQRGQFHNFSLKKKKTLLVFQALDNFLYKLIAVSVFRLQVKVLLTVF